MSVAEDFFNVLSGFDALTDLVGDSIFHNAADEGASLPMVVFGVSTPTDESLSGADLSPASQITVNVWSGGGTLSANEVADAVIAACEDHDSTSSVSVTVLERSDQYDQETALDGQVLLVEWWP